MPKTRQHIAPVTGHRANSPGEVLLLQQIRSRTARSAPGLRLGIGDDCALLNTRPGEELAVTTDLSIAGRHFRIQWHPPKSIGHRTLARGLSDLAAMGARPVAAFLSLGLPRELTQASARQPAWIQRFLDGFLALAATHKTPLAGGDLAESPLAVADVVLVGAVPRGKALLRCGARPGDLLYVTGSLGAASAGLLKLGELAAAAKNHSRPPAIPRKLLPMLSQHLYPQPRIAQGLWLQRHRRATAALDLSDGLSTDLAHLCAESGVGADVDAAALPIAPGATLLQALHGGEDYELLFTASPASRLPRAIAGVPITPIGRIVRARRSQALITLMTPRGPEPLEPHGWEHFSHDANTEKAR
jgi:thiamine-monophosphate kinase